MVVTYCTHTDVANFLRITIDGTTTPSQAQVELIINRMEDEIDRRTGHAWRTTTITNELHDLPLLYTYGWGTPIFLQHRNLLAFSTGAGDKIEVWNGTTFADVSGDVGTSINFEPVRGKIYYRGLLFTIMRKNRVRITYRYGDAVVPGDIKEAVIKMVAIDLLSASFKMDTIPMGSKGISPDESMFIWRMDVERLIKNREEVMVI